MALLPGTVLGRYEIRSKLGEGGMGEVYLARDGRLGRDVALKILPTEVSSNQERMRRFQQEARAAASLNHPNIAHIYEIGEEGETNFIAMEFVEGHTLREKIHREREELNQLLKYLVQVSEGLAKAHSAGVVHRDLKPDNIMVTRDGYAKILDFGLAKLIEKRNQEALSELGEAATARLPAQHSAPGLVVGTAAYMSPEQARGLSVDERSDIFSFGCILYEAATGRKPFAGDSIIDTLHKIIYEPAPAVTDFNPGAPAELQRIIRKCLAKEPNKRYQTIRDAANDLEALLEELKGTGGMERSVAPTIQIDAASGTTKGTDADRIAAESAATISAQTAASGAEDLLTKIKRHKAGFALALTALLVASVLGAYFYFARTSAAAIDSIAVLPFVNSSGDPGAEYLSDGITESIINSLSQLPQLKVMARSTVFRYKGKNLDPQTVGRELGVRAVLTGRLLQQGDQLIVSAEMVKVSDGTQLWGEQYNRKMTDLVQLQSEISREVSQKLRARLSGADEQRLAKRDTENATAYQLYLKGRYHWNKRSAEGFKKAIEYFQQAIDLDPNFALAYSGLSDSYALFTNPVIADSLPPRDGMPKAKAAATKALQLDDTLAEAHTSLGLVKDWYDWDFAGAESEYRRAIELNPNYPSAHHRYGFFLEEMGRLDEARAELKRALELDPLSIPINTDFAYNYTLSREYDQAIEQLKKTLEIDPNAISVHRNLFTVYERLGRNEEAVNEYLKVQELSGESQERIAASREAYAKAGIKGFWQKRLEILLEDSQRKFVPAYNIAILYARLGEKEQAFAWLEKAYDERDRSLLLLNIAPATESLRSDPRFAELARRLGISRQS